MRGLIVTALLALSACASAPLPPPIDQPATSAIAPSRAPDLDGDVIALAFSGGGARAASFSLGVLQGLRDMRGADGARLLDHVHVLTSVSGGAITAAYFALHGAEGLDTFRAAYLDKNWAGQLHIAAYSPANWTRAWSGGLNRQDRFADWLDREVFAHASMADLRARSGLRIWINSTDLYNGTPFAFTPLYFDALCADLDHVRVADAVAASMAFPVVFKPVVAQPYPEHCAPLPAWALRAPTNRDATALERRTAQAFASYRDPARLRYVQLVDGGVLDNLGLSTLALLRQTADTPYSPLSARDAVRIRRLTFLVVNAEKVRTAAWTLTQSGPNGPQTADTLFDLQTESTNRASYDYFRRVAADWERDLSAWRCALSAEDVARYGGGVGWACADIHISVDMISFNDLPEPQRSHLGVAATAVTLPRDLIDGLIAGGRQAVMQNPAALALTH